MTKLIHSGYDETAAIDHIRRCYGESLSVTNILQALLATDTGGKNKDKVVSSSSSSSLVEVHRYPNKQGEDPSLPSKPWSIAAVVEKQGWQIDASTSLTIRATKLADKET